MRISLAAATGAALWAIAATQAAAVTVTVDLVNAQTVINGSNASDSSTPVAQSDQTQTFGAQSIDTVTAKAVQNEDGYSEVRLTVSNSGVEGLAANGSQTTIDASAAAQRQITFTNDTGTATVGTFDFRISGVELELVHGGGGPIDPEASVSFTANANKTLGGALLDDYQADLTFAAGFNDFRIDSANGFGGTIQRQDCFGTVCTRGVLPVNILTGSLNLGVLQPGESVSVKTVLTVQTKYNGTEIGALAKAFDPNGGSYFSSTFTPVGTPPAVPLPAGGLLLITALAGTAAWRRRKSR